MNKTLIKTAAAAVVMFGISAAPLMAIAPTLSVSVDAINGTAVTPGSPSTVTINVPTLPWTVPVDGTGSVTTGAIDGMNLELSDNAVDFYNDHYWQNIGSGSSHPFSVPWTIGSAGAHTIVATVTRGNADGSDTVDVTVNTLNIVVNQCPAAPAIAAAYMQSHGVKSGSAKWKAVINYVAGQTGSKGIFWAAHSCDSGYRAAVEAYVAAHI